MQAHWHGISKKNLTHATRASRGTLDSTFPVVFRNGFFRDEAGALISDNEALPSVFNYTSRDNDLIIHTNYKITIYLKKN